MNNFRINEHKLNKIGLFTGDAIHGLRRPPPRTTADDGYCLKYGFKTALTFEQKRDEMPYCYLQETMLGRAFNWRRKFLSMVSPC
jgi:hypothetical protein